MEIYDFHQLFESKEFQKVKAVISIGVFDGFHRGHQLILNSAKEEANKRENTKVVVFTFSQNPKTVIGRNPYKNPLMTLRQSTEFFDDLNVDYLVVIDFSSDISKLTGREFIGRCCSMFDIQAVVVGEDFRCGHNADTGVQELLTIVNELCEGAILKVPPTYKLSDGRVDSSTLVRHYLGSGEVSKIESLLGRPYTVDLAHLHSKSGSDFLRYSIGAFVQLLPPPGLYECLLVTREMEKFLAVCEIDSEYVTLKLENLPSGGLYFARFDNVEILKELT
ncbi:MAG: FAD synthetase family protein [Sphaerochaetaceae bacterium]